MKKLLLAVLFALIAIPATLFAQDQSAAFNLMLDTRFDYTLKLTDNDAYPTKSSFDGKFLNVTIDGQINEQFSYNYRQRLFLDGEPNYKSFFKATDWMYLTYRFHRNWDVSAGKQVVAIGGYEYDYAPINQYFWSAFWNNVVCYQLGATVAYNSNDKNHRLAFQISNSPFTTESLQGIYAYNLIWYGKFNAFSTIYSVNRIEHEKGRYINYLALGNKLSLGSFSLELDYMNRYADAQKNPFSDFSLICQIDYHFNDQISAFVKGGYDENSSQSPEDTEVNDKFVVPGTQYAYAGAGVQYYPIKNKKNVRLHGYVASNNDDPRYYTFNLGLTWQMNLFGRK